MFRSSVKSRTKRVEQGRFRTSKTFAGKTSHQALQPSCVLLCFFDGYWVTFLEYFVNGNEGLESLDFIGDERLPDETKVSIRRQIL